MCRLLSLSSRGTVVALAAGLAFVAPPPPPGTAAADRGNKRAVTVEKVEYKGWKNNLRLANGDAELLVTLDVGPRVLRYRAAGGTNVFREFEDQLGTSGEKEWVGRGGHRLWVGPEDLTRTYAPDNGPVEYKELGPGSVRLTQPPDRPYGVQKEVEITLAPKGTGVTLLHRVTNVGSGPTDLAVWALSVMAPGGVEVMPLPPKRPHPGPPQNARSPADYAPDQTLVLWPFFDFTDPRWTFGSKYILLRQDPRAKGPTKIGLAQRQGWAAYLNAGTLFVKRFDYQEGKAYPDRGANFETFTNADMLEIETLGPLTRLAPGEKAELTERWELFAGGGLPDAAALKGDADVDRVVGPRVKGQPR